jgi:hypothetical protein
VKISLKNEVFIDGNTVCHLEPKSGGKCAMMVAHPESSLLMFTLADGKYSITPAGVQVPYYHNDQRTDHWFVVRKQDGSPVGECSVKLEQLAPERVYRERCAYSSIVVDVVTKRHPTEKKFVSVVGTIAKDTGVQYFIVE